MTRIAERTVVEPTDEIRSEKWKNLAFLKDGKTRLGHVVFPTHRAAKEWADYVVVELRNGRALTWHDEHGERFFFRDLSHLIQIPFKQS